MPQLENEIKSEKASIREVSLPLILVLKYIFCNTGLLSCCVCKCYCNL